MNKINPLHLVYAASAALILFMGTIIYKEDNKNQKKEISQLHPTVQAAIREYMEEQPKLRVGDFVVVRNYDNLESSRMLEVASVEMGDVTLKDGRAPESEAETLLLESGFLDSGLRAARRMTEKYNFVFIRKDSPSWLANATWYYTQ